MTMRNNLIILGTVLLFAGNAAFAAPSPKEERIGVGIGVTVGAVAGGPVGAILGAAIGAKFGDNYHKKNTEIDSLTASLNDKSMRVGELEQSVASLNRNISVLDSDLRRLQAQARPELVSLLAAGIEMDLLFRTDEDVLRDDTRSRISQLASTLAGMSDVRVQLDGFADERGDAEYNKALSARRAEHIRDVLLGHGVADERITITAHGEAPAADAQPDSYALQRKVSLRLFIDDAPAVAANPQ
jgi:outer membrane protein OmpA-like peptidoglycan-associated protein